MSPGLHPGPGKNTFSSFAVKDVGSDGEESSCNVGDPGSISGSGRFPWRREWQPTPVFLPGEFHGPGEAWSSTVHGVAKSQT